MTGEQVLIIEEDESDGRPAAFALQGTYPDPFNPVTTFSIELPIASRVILEVYNVRGSLVASFLNSSLPAGYHEISFEGSSMHRGFTSTSCRRAISQPVGKWC
jgi:hypothetical protein